MADNTVRITGMFGAEHTYFSDSPVVINAEGLEWPQDTPISVVRIEVLYNNAVVGEFNEDVGRSSKATFDISSALKAIWNGYDFAEEVSEASIAKSGRRNGHYTRPVREYSLMVYTEYVASDGVFTQTSFGPFTGGKCIMGGMTEMERYGITEPEEADVSSLEDTNPNNGDASTKPNTTPEKVGQGSITSWVDVAQGVTDHYFYIRSENGSSSSDSSDSDSSSSDSSSSDSSSSGSNPHAPMVLRDSVTYIDFLFVNRRGALETCSAQMKEALSINVDTKQYSRVGKPSFIPERSLMAIGSDGRRSWSMSSGYQTREWAEWWTMEFLGGKRKQWWMWYNGKFMPVTIEPAKKTISIYDHTKQQMPSVEFTVTLALEG